MIDIAAGGAHSACVTAAGDLYTWGKGRYGRLGHSDSEDQLKPKLVRRHCTQGPGDRLHPNFSKFKVVPVVDCSFRVGGYSPSIYKQVLFLGEPYGHVFLGHLNGTVLECPIIYTGKCWHLARVPLQSGQGGHTAL